MSPIELAIALAYTGVPLEWAQAVQFPGGFPAEERKLVLQALVMQAHRPGFKAAAGPVIAVWRRLLAATGLACAPCEPAQRSSSDPV